MARDIIHNQIKNALIKDGWSILADPFRIDYEGISLAADLALEKAFAMERQELKIVVEVKSFVGLSFIKQLQYALGQYEMYRDFMSVTVPEYELWLGLSDLIYNNFFEQKAVQLIIQRHRIKLVVVNIEQEEVVRWIP